MDNLADSIAASKTTGTGQASAVPVSQQEPEAAKKKYRTVGNIIYDFGVFGSVAWAGVAILSAVSAHEANFGTNKAFNWLRSLNTNVTNGLEKGLSKTILKNAKPETVKGYAKGSAMFLTLGMGGNALMAPIKWLEDNRQKNAARIDKTLGTMPPDPETIAHEPKQTWKSVFSGRIFSWGMSYVAFLAMGPKITDKIQNWFGEKAATGWMKARPKSNEANVKRWANIVAFDALFTVITATLTYGISRYFAKKGEEPASVADDLYVMNTSASRMFVPSAEAESRTFSKHVERKSKIAPAASFTEKVTSEPPAEHARV